MASEILIRGTAGTIEPKIVSAANQRVRMNIVYIAGCTHGGTTLLYRLLNAHPEIIAVGSVNNLAGKVRTRNKPCQCGQPVSSCGFWSCVNAKVKESDKSQSLLGLSVNDSDPDAFLRDNKLFYHAISKSSGFDIVVDSSRKAGRLKKLRSSFGSDLIKVIVIYKKPPAQIFSWTKNGKTSKGKFSFVRSLLRYNLNWLSIIKATWGFENVYTVSYEGFCDEARDVLSAVFDFLKVDSSQELIDSILESDLKDLQCHALGGQPLSFSPSELKKDERWRDSFSMPRKVASWVGCYLPYIILRRRTVDERGRL